MAKKQKCWTLANIISITRLLIAPSLIYFMYIKEFKTSFIIFMLLALTDIIDGKVAKYNHNCTRLGSILDAFSDRVIILIAMVGLFIKGVPQYVLVIFILLIILEMFIGISFTLKTKKLYLDQVHRNSLRYTARSIYFWLASWIIDMPNLNFIRTSLTILVIVMSIISFVDYYYYLKNN